MSPPFRSLPLSRGAGALGVAAALLLLVPHVGVTSVSAQGPGSSPRAAPAANPDFLFRAPGVALTLRTGVAGLRASGGFFDVTTDLFTAERSDFRGYSLGAELAAIVNDHFDVTVAFDGIGVRVDHESRIYEELDGTPVFQSTRLRAGPALQFGARGFLLPRGESMANLAWVPNRVAPFVGGGVGWTAWELRQWGDFGFTTSEGDFILADDLSDSGWSALAYLGAGTELHLARNWALTLEGRYQFASTQVGGDFIRLTDPTLDLSGLRLTAGLSVRY